MTIEQRTKLRDTATRMQAGGWEEMHPSPDTILSLLNALDRAEEALQATREDIQPLHDLIQTRSDWAVTAWGKNVCYWAAEKIRELEAKNS